jgi:hypothetical protein
MDGAHDMGGAKGFGPVVSEPNEPVFHGDWERRAFALTVAMARPGGWNIDMSRFARENRPPEDYLSKSYFQIWLAGLETLMIERGLVTREEIEAGKVLSPPKSGVTPIAPTEITPAHLDELADYCSAGSLSDCDDLYLESPSGSAYEEFGSSCGATSYFDLTGDCAVDFDSGLNANVGTCDAGDMVACDALYWASPIGSLYEAFGAFCGLYSEEALMGDCAAVLGA